MTGENLCPRPLFLSALLLALAGSVPASGQSPRVLYTWNGTGNVQSWFKNFGANTLAIENTTAGELTVTEMGTAGSDFALSDDFNVISEGAPTNTIGGLDATGLSAIEFDMGHNGTADVNVQFFVQASAGATYVSLGPDLAVSPGIKTYSAPLAGLAPDQIAYIRTVGINVREHADQGNLVWTIREVRTVGPALTERFIVTHEPGTSDNGLQGAFVNYNNASVEGNDGGQNQTGLSQNLGEPPAGNTGSLHWVDLASGPGAAVSWVNGTIFNGNTFNERPADLSNYQKLVLRIAATNVVPDTVFETTVGYFFQTGNYAFSTAGSNQTLRADGEFHDLEFPIASIPNLAFVVGHGVAFQPHTGGDLAIDVDSIQVVTIQFTDCNSNLVPDERDLLEKTSKDCNANGVPDECDIASALSADCDKNGIPDECDTAGPPDAQVLYTWAATGNTQGWEKRFGDNESSPENSIDGELTALETGASVGKGWALGDGFNQIVENGPSSGGLDLTGRTSLEFDLGHNGLGPVNVQFYLQATPDFQFIALGPDQAIQPGVATYSAPIDFLTPAQIAYNRVVGINIRDHTGEGNLTWTLREVRAIGTKLRQRDFATHGPDALDGGLQGAVVAFDFVAVSGNDGTQNQTGLLHNTGPLPPGNTGSLRWTDLQSANGGAVAWFDGTVFKGSTFNERPTDMSNFQQVIIRMAATNVTPDNEESVGVQYILQTANFQSHQAGPAQDLPADGKFHELVFPIGDIPDRAFVDAHVIDLLDHQNGDLIIDVDNIRAVSTTPTPSDCNGNLIPDSCDIKNGAPDANSNGIPDSCEQVTATFRRADSNGDGALDISDPIYTLAFLFTGGPAPACPDSADSNNDEAVDISDAVYSLAFLYTGGADIPPPGPQTCGADPDGTTLGECGYSPDLCR